jgi:hypothetical protein
MRNRCSRARWLVVVVGAVATAVALFVSLAGGARNSHPGLSTNSVSTTAGSVQPVVTEADVRRLEAALSSSDPAVFESVLAPQLRAAMTPAVLRSSELPAGSTLTIDRQSAARSGNTMSAIAIVRGSRSATFRLVLILDHGEWFLMASEQQ